MFEASCGEPRRLSEATWSPPVGICAPLLFFFSLHFKVFGCMFYFLKACVCVCHACVCIAVCVCFHWCLSLNQSLPLRPDGSFEGASPGRWRQTQPTAADILCHLRPFFVRLSLAAVPASRRQPHLIIPAALFEYSRPQGGSSFEQVMWLLRFIIILADSCVGAEADSVSLVSDRVTEFE